MKKHIIIMLAAVAALTSCGKDTVIPEKSGVRPVVFDLTASHPQASKTVKDGWETGDAIFVFFSGAAAPKHLKMTYDGTAWTSAEYEGAAASAGALGLRNGDSGSMRAVFLPFGSDATVAASGTSFTFSNIRYTYYLTATLDYTVTDNKVSGAFNMTIPEGYVQFFVKDPAAEDGGYRLGTDAVIPAGVASIEADGTVTEETLAAGDDMTGYAYGAGAGKGYLFSGRLNRSYGHSGSYYFAKTRYSDRSRADYFVTGKTLSSHDAVNLPANDNVYNVDPDYDIDGKWVPVGNGIYVELRRNGDEYPITGCAWATCNIHQSKPEDVGDKYTFSDLANMGSVPLKDPYEALSNTRLFTYTPMTVHGKKGFVISADKGFIFLPLTSSTSPYCQYWSKSEMDETTGYYFEFAAQPGVAFTPGNKTASYAVRLIR